MRNIINCQRCEIELTISNTAKCTKCLKICKDPNPCCNHMYCIKTNRLNRDYTQVFVDGGIDASPVGICFLFCDECHNGIMELEDETRLKLLCSIFMSALGDGNYVRGKKGLKK